MKFQIGSVQGPVEDDHDRSVYYWDIRLVTRSLAHYNGPASRQPTRKAGHRLRGDERRIDIGKHNEKLRHRSDQIRNRTDTCLPVPGREPGGEK